MMKGTTNSSSPTKIFKRSSIWKRNKWICLLIGGIKRNMSPAKSDSIHFLYLIFQSIYSYTRSFQSIFSLSPSYLLLLNFIFSIYSPLHNTSLPFSFKSNIIPLTFISYFTFFNLKFFNSLSLLFLILSPSLNFTNQPTKMFKNIFNIAKIATFNKATPLKFFKPTSAIHYKINYAFTSTSNPSQVALM